MRICQVGIKEWIIAADNRNAKAGGCLDFNHVSCVGFVIKGLNVFGPGIKQVSAGHPRSIKCSCKAVSTQKVAGFQVAGHVFGQEAGTVVAAGVAELHQADREEGHQAGHADAQNHDGDQDFGHRHAAA